MNSHHVDHTELTRTSRGRIVRVRDTHTAVSCTYGRHRAAACAPGGGDLYFMYTVVCVGVGAHQPLIVRYVHVPWHHRSSSSSTFSPRCRKALGASVTAATAAGCHRPCASR